MKTPKLPSMKALPVRTRLAPRPKSTVPKPKTTRPKPASVVARVSPARVTPKTVAIEAEGLIRDIATRRARIANDFFEIGVALSRLSTRPLYTSLGYASFDELLQKRRVMTRMQASKLIAVSQAYPKQQALSLGVEKAYALVRYAAATPAPDLARSLATADARIAGKPLRDLTVKQLRDATKTLHGVMPPNDHDLEEARATARKLQKKLRAEGASSAKVRAHREGIALHLRIDMDVKDASALLD